MPEDHERAPETLIARLGEEPEFELEGEFWTSAGPLTIGRYWSGEQAPDERAFEAWLLWSPEAFFAKFTYKVHETPVIDPEPDLSRKSIGLWERDVCELFITPESGEIRRYFEFEVAPNGEWLDLALEAAPDGRRTDWEFRSGMAAKAQILNGQASMSIRIPWASVGGVPQTGDEWRGNIFRAVGGGDDRGYIAWSPTFTEVPNFHVPERFGRFVFGG